MTGALGDPDHRPASLEQGARSRQLPTLGGWIGPDRRSSCTGQPLGWARRENIVEVRRLAMARLLLLALVALTGCGATASTAPRRSSASSRTTVALTEPAPESTTSTSSPAMKALPTCQSSQLHLVSNPAGWHANEAASGQFTETFTFTNISSEDCNLGGWPGLEALVGGVPQPTKAIRVRQGGPTGSPWTTVTLVVGGAASFGIYGQDFDVVSDKPCPAVTSGFLVIPPDDTTQTVVAAPEPDCGSFFVAPVIAGKLDRSAWSTVVSG